MVGKAPTPPSATASASTSLSWGNTYKTPGDMPVEKRVFILPKEDYRHACFVWQVPNGEVVIPGKDLYRLPSEKTILNSAFGFMDEDVLEDFGVVAVDSCSDWNEYARQRDEGNWATLLASLSSSSTVQSADPIAPEPLWNRVKSVSGWFLLSSNTGEANDKWWMDEANSGTGGAVDKAWGKKFLKSLLPSLVTTSADFSTGNYTTQSTNTYSSPLVTFSSSRGIDSFADVFYAQDRPQFVELLSRLQEGNLQSGTLSIDAPASTFTGSYKIGDYTIDSSTTQLIFLFKEIQ